jgi:hypothetical protein
LVLRRGIEPPTYSLPMNCSTPELPQHFKSVYFISIGIAIFLLFY